LAKKLGELVLGERSWYPKEALTSKNYLISFYSLVKVAAAVPSLFPLHQKIDMRYVFFTNELFLNAIFTPIFSR